MTYTMSWEKKDRWSELADEYTSMLDELNNEKDETSDVFLNVDEFDELEII